MGSPASKSGVTPVMVLVVTRLQLPTGPGALADVAWPSIRSHFEPSTGDVQKMCLNKDLTSSQLPPGHNSPSPQQEVAGVQSRVLSVASKHTH